MKRITGYYATQRRHGRARAVESPVRRAERTAQPRRYGQQTHAVGGRTPTRRVVLWIGLAVVIGVVLASRRSTRD